MTIADTAWSWDNVSLNTMAYYVRSVDESPPARRGVNPAVPGVSGSRYIPGKVLGERELTLMMVIDAQPPLGGARSGAQLKNNLDTIKKLFAADGLHMLQRTHGGSTRQMSVEVSDLRITRGGPYHYNVAARLVAANPFWYALLAGSFTTTWSVIPLLPGTLSVTNNGTYTAERSLITVVGPVTNPIVSATNGSWVRWAGTLATSDLLIINCDTFDCVVDRVSSEPYSDVENVTWAAGFTRWLTIPTGTAPVTLSGSGASSVTRLTIQFTEAYL
jgi:hypothetical protein